jgi:hypothetical protein
VVASTGLITSMAIEHLHQMPGVTSGIAMKSLQGKIRRPDSEV